MAGERKFEVGAFQTMSPEQLFNNLRYGDILIEGAAT
jgi:hypothetical protein